MTWPPSSVLWNSTVQTTSASSSSFSWIQMFEPWGTEVMFKNATSRLNVRYRSTASIATRVFRINSTSCWVSCPTWERWLSEERTSFISSTCKATPLTTLFSWKCYLPRGMMCRGPANTNLVVRLKRHSPIHVTTNDWLRRDRMMKPALSNERMSREQCEPKNWRCKTQLCNPPKQPH